MKQVWQIDPEFRLLSVPLSLEEENRLEKDNAGLMAIKFFAQMGVKKIYLIHRLDIKISFTTHFFGKIQYVGIK